MLRFKTKGEFLREFGPNWRYKISLNWVEEMDPLLGVPLTASQIENIKDGKIIRMGRYKFSMEMVIDSEAAPEEINVFIKKKKKRIKINVSI